TGASGKHFVTAKVRVATSSEESLFVSVICFDDAPCRALLALGEGDSVSLAGQLTPKVWTDKTGTAKPALDLVAQQVLTAYHVTRKRRAVSGQDDEG
ncbi:MAG: single-stranded DNA-binding protein, partial [Rhodoferax sp.]